MPPWYTSLKNSIKYTAFSVASTNVQPECMAKGNPLSILFLVCSRVILFFLLNFFEGLTSVPVSLNLYGVKSGYNKAMAAKVRVIFVPVALGEQRGNEVPLVD